MRTLIKIRGSVFESVFIYFFIILFSSDTCFAQINEPVSNEVYNYLYRMAEKGIVNWKDYQLPADRKMILAVLRLVKENSSIYQA